MVLVLITADMENFAFTAVELQSPTIAPIDYFANIVLKYPLVFLPFYCPIDLGVIGEYAHAVLGERQSGRSLTYIKKRRGPSIDPLGTP